MIRMAELYGGSRHLVRAPGPKTLFAVAAARLAQEADAYAADADEAEGDSVSTGSS